MQSRYIDAVVRARRPLTDRITEFLIEAADGSRLPTGDAGSHVELRFGGAQGRFLRHYSMVGPLEVARDAEPFWRIAVQRENRSRGSAFIHDHFKPGTALRVSRPLNAFRLSRGQPHTLLVAGGIGITPILAMARSLRRRGENFTVLYAGQDRAGMAYVDELQEICGERLTVHETRQSGTPDLTGLLAKQPAGTLGYICGPGPMIEAFVAAGHALGWPPERTRFEVFNAAHQPDDDAMEIVLKSGQAVTVGAGTTILDALEAAGVETFSDCRRGECGLCATGVIATDGAIDHRDRFFSDEERVALRQMTICCSRTTGRRIELDL